MVESTRCVTRREMLQIGAAGLLPLASREEPRRVLPSRARQRPRDAASDALHFSSIWGTAELIRTRELSPVELTEMMLARIERFNAGLKSYVTVMADAALVSARRAENEITAGNYHGPLHGIPIGVKDLFFSKGVPTMGGMKVLEHHVPTFDATVVARLHRAGAILLGKQNLTEAAVAGYHPEFDVPVNPWDATRWPGGSSSGSAVGTASGLCFASLGSDTGGSICYPAASCGVVGLKPTFCRVSRYGALDLARSLDHVGPIARRSVDVAVVLEAIAGMDANDPTTLNAAAPQIVGDIDRDIKDVRIGFDERFATQNVERSVVDAMTRALRVYEQLGAHVVDVTVPDFSELGLAFWTILASEAVATHAATYPSRADDYGPWMRDFLEHGAGVTGAEYVKWNNVRALFNGGFEKALADVDVLASPSMAALPYANETSPPYRAMEPWDTVVTFGPPFVLAANFSGRPTISIPCGFSQGRLPHSLQLLGRHMDESLLCRMGQAYEDATSWHHTHPVL